MTETLTTLTCPRCGYLLVRIVDKDGTRYRCASCSIVFKRSVVGSEVHWTGVGS